MQSIDLYKDYLLERENCVLVRSENGFATYKYDDTNFYVIDIFVHSSFRDGREYLRLGKQLISIAKDKGFKKMIGFVSCDANDPTDNMRNLLAWEFKIIGQNDTQIVLEKEL